MTKLSNFFLYHTDAEIAGNWFEHQSTKIHIDNLKKNTQWGISGNRNSKPQASGQNKIEPQITTNVDRWVRKAKGK